MTEQMTCIICPRGCTLQVKMDGNTIKEITGNSCPRGKEYAENEKTNPVRTLTTTMATIEGGVVAVKTDKPIPKDKLFLCMKEINKMKAEVPVSVGQILVEDILETGANVVATQNYNN